MLLHKAKEEVSGRIALSHEFHPHELPGPVWIDCGMVSVTPDDGIIFGASAAEIIASVDREGLWVSSDA